MFKLTPLLMWRNSFPNNGDLMKSALTFTGLMNHFFTEKRAKCFWLRSVGQMAFPARTA